MLTLGIDLATAPAKSGACLLRWSSRTVRVEKLAVGWDDDDVLRELVLADWSGIDAPFGWPRRFVSAVRDHAERGVWPASEREAFRLRLTDRVVRELTDLRPMSVSTDRIGATAMRCAWLLSCLGESRGRRVDLLGAEGVAEVYPAAALKVWAQEDSSNAVVWQGYKRAAGTADRERILGALEQIVGELQIDPSQRALCRASDDALDALVCALVARAVGLGLTHRPSGDESERAREEGWIHVPRPGSLAQLGA